MIQICPIEEVPAQQDAAFAKQVSSRDTDTIHWAVCAMKPDAQLSLNLLCALGSDALMAQSNLHSSDEGCCLLTGHVPYVLIHKVQVGDADGLRRHISFKR